VEYLKGQAGFILLALAAPTALRFERVQKRGRNESASTLDAFIKKEAQERSDNPDAQQLDRCLAMADRTIVNDGSLEELHRKLEELL
jgi:dephospho-CoA kinase